MEEEIKREQEQEREKFRKEVIKRAEEILREIQISKETFTKVERIMNEHITIADNAVSLEDSGTTVLTILKVEMRPFYQIIKWARQAIDNTINEMYKGQ